MKGNFVNQVREKHFSPGHCHFDHSGRYEEILASKNISGIVSTSFLEKLSRFQEDNVWSQNYDFYIDTYDTYKKTVILFQIQE